MHSHRNRLFLPRRSYRKFNAHLLMFFSTPHIRRVSNRPSDRHKSIGSIAGNQKRSLKYPGAIGDSVQGAQASPRSPWGLRSQTAAIRRHHIVDICVESTESSIQLEHCERPYFAPDQLMESVNLTISQNQLKANLSNVLAPHCCQFNPLSRASS